VLLTLNILFSVVVSNLQMTCPLVSGFIQVEVDEMETIRNLYFLNGYFCTSISFYINNDFKCLWDETNVVEVGAMQMDHKECRHLLWVKLLHYLHNQAEYKPLLPFTNWVEMKESLEGKSR